MNFRSREYLALCNLQGIEKFKDCRVYLNSREKIIRNSEFYYESILEKKVWMKEAIDRSILTEFAVKIRARRREIGLTQEQLAVKAELHVNYVGGIERGQRNPTLESIVRLARALKISPKDLMAEN